MSHGNRMRKWTQTLVTMSALLLLSTAGAFAAGQQEVDVDEITFWGWVPEVAETTETFNELDEFDFTVDHEDVGVAEDQYEQLLAALAAGDGAPDVVQIEFQFLEQFKDAGGVIDLSEYGADQFEDEYLDWTWELVSDEGPVYAIPWDQGPTGWHYRQDIFEEAGWDEFPATWDEFREAAEDIQAEHGEDVHIANFDVTDRAEFMSYAWQGGAQWFEEVGDDQWQLNVDDEITNQLFEYWGEMIDEGLVSTFASDADQLAAQEEGRDVSSVSAAWSPALLEGAVPDQEGLWRVTHKPQWEEGEERSGNWGGSTLAVTPQAEDPQAALEFAVWMTSNMDALQQNWDQAATFPVTPAGLEMDELYTPNEFFGGQVIADLYSEAAERVPEGFEFSPWELTVDEAFEEAASAAIDGEIAWSDAAAEMERIIASEAEAQGYTIVE